MLDPEFDTDDYGDVEDSLSESNDDSISSEDGDEAKDSSFDYESLHDSRVGKKLEIICYPHPLSLHLLLQMGW